MRKLGVLVGDWTSESLNLATGVVSLGRSSIQWTIGDRWLQWRFTMSSGGQQLEVVTLMGFERRNRRYAFYSFNPIDDEPIPHHGGWVDPNTLRLETEFGGERVRVEFRILADGRFVQEHSRPNAAGQWGVTSRTTYSRQGRSTPHR